MASPDSTTSANSDLYMFSLETYGGRRVPFPRNPEAQYLLLTCPPQATHQERHTIAYVGHRPIIDLTDGYFNATELLLHQRFLTPYFRAMADLPCMQKFRTIFADEISAYRVIGKIPRFWYHPYLMMLYRHIYDQRLSDWHRTDIQIIEASYTYCLSRGGVDYFNAFAHADIDHNLRMSVGEWIEFNSRFQERRPYICRQEFIYLIRAGKTQLFKIGRTTDPKARLQGLQGANPRPLSLIAVWKVTNSHQVEKDVHTQFAAYRRRGEWFELSLVDQAELIMSMKQQGWERQALGE